MIPNLSDRLLTGVYFIILFDWQLVNWPISTLFVLKTARFLFDGYLIEGHFLSNPKPDIAEFLFDWKLANWLISALFVLKIARFLFDGYLIKGHFLSNPKHKTAEFLFDWQLAKCRI